VYVDGTEIPVINQGVAVEARKSGSADAMRVADVYFPAEWDASSYEVLEAIEYYDSVKVEFWSSTLEAYLPVFSGYVTGLGSGSTTNNERRLRAADPSFFLGDVHVNKTFGGSGTVKPEDVISFVVNQVNKRTPAEITSTVTADPGLTGGFWGTVIEEFTGVTIKELFQRKFTANRHTAKDVLDWFCEQTAAIYYFAPTDTPTLVVAESTSTTYSAGASEDSGVVLHDNNALSELRPVNCLDLRGSAKHRLSLGPLDANMPLGDGNFPRAVVEHPDLVERAGGKRITRVVDDSNAVGVTEAVGEAARRLKKAIDQPSGGTMICWPAPRLDTYDKLEAVPACDDVISSAPELPYEIERVRHVARNTSAEENASAEESVTAYTEVTGSLYTPIEDITTVDEHTKMVPTSKRSVELDVPT